MPLPFIVSQWEFKHSVSFNCQLTYTLIDPCTLSPNLNQLDFREHQREFPSVWPADDDNSQALLTQLSDDSEWQLKKILVHLSSLNFVISCSCLIWPLQDKMLYSQPSLGDILLLLDLNFLVCFHLCPHRQQNLSLEESWSLLSLFEKSHRGRITKDLDLETHGK